MKGFFQYFNLTQAEQRGFFVLVVLIIFVLLFPVMYSFTRESDTPESSIVYFADEKKEKQEAKYAPVEESRDVLSSVPTSEKHITYFDFDPNALPVEDWERLGFSKKQITVIKNYESKGGKFYTKEDVKKIYSISTQDYKRIEPYIKISEKESHRFGHVASDSIKSSRSNPVIPLMIEINKADTSEFKRLKGIGPVLSARIIKYRNALGGFNKTEQVAEVYGITSECYEQIKDKLFLDTAIIRKLNINQLTKQDLSKHPYISRKQAELIVNYREQHGYYKGIDNLREIPVLNEDFFRKIAPYLQF